MIRKRHTPERQHTAPQTCWPALVVQVITAGHPGPEVRLATRAGLPASALFPPRLAETRLSPSGVGVCGEHIVQILSGLWAGPSVHFLIHIRGIFPFCP